MTWQDSRNRVVHELQQRIESSDVTGCRRWAIVLKTTPVLWVCLSGGKHWYGVQILSSASTTMMPYARRLVEISSLTADDIQKTWIYQTQTLVGVNRERHGFNFSFEIANFGLRKLPTHRSFSKKHAMRMRCDWLGWAAAAECADYVIFCLGSGCLACVLSLLCGTLRSTLLRSSTNYNFNKEA